MNKLLAHDFHADQADQTTPAQTSLRLLTLRLKVDDRVAGMFLAWAGVREKAMPIVPPRGGQFVFEAPDFLEHQIAAAFGFRFLSVPIRAIRGQNLRSD